MFLVTDDIDLASYVDDNTIYCIYDCVDDGMASLVESANKCFGWFFDNKMKRSTDKFHLIRSNTNVLKSV